MGGPGSGNHWHYGAKSTTDDSRSIDVRWLVREGLLKPGSWRRLQWTRNGETVASIVLQAAQGSVTLIYRHCRGAKTGRTSSTRCPSYERRAI